MRACAGLLVAGLLAPLAGQAQLSSIRPGQYEITVDVKIDPAGAPTQPAKRLECVTATDLKEAAKLLSGAEMENCKVSDVRTTGNTTRFAISCEEDGSRMTGSSAMTISADTIAQVSTMKDSDGRVVTMKVFARRVGECRQ